MDELLINFGRIAWAQLWQVSLLIGGVWLVLRMVGRNRPHLACALWLVVLTKCVTPPVLSSPSGIFCWLQGAEQVVTHDDVDLPTAGYEMPPMADEDAVVVRVSGATAPVSRQLPDLTPPPFPAAEVTASAEPMPRQAWSWSTILGTATSVWLSGVLIFAANATRRLLACWRKLRGARQINEPALVALIGDLRRRLMIRRRIRLLVTESPLGPAVVGLWRPTVILPAAIVRENTPAQLEPLLAHELLHVRRGDLWIGMLQTVALALWWFHPLVRLASRLVTREAERCCDEETIAHLGCDPAAYARSLLDVLALKQELTPIPAFPGVRPVDVTSQRLERIMKLGQGCHKRTPWWCWLIMLAASAAVLPGAAFVARAKERPKPATQDLKQYVHSDFPQLDDEAAAKPAELLTKTYDLANLVTTLATELDQSEAHTRQLLDTLTQLAAPGPWEPELGVLFGQSPLAEEKRSTEKDSRPLGGDKPLASDPTKRSLGWKDGKLVVRQTAEGHWRIEQQFAVLREHGHAELAVEVRIISGPAAVFDTEGVDWRMIGSAGKQEGSRGAERLAGNAGGNAHGTAVSVIEKNVPALVALVNQSQAKALLEAAQQHSRTNVIQAPKVTLFNGQTARVEDSVQRPFVVGVTPVKKGDATTLKPTIRVVTEGTSIRLRPVAQKDGTIQLDFDLELSQIRDVDTAEFPAGPGKEPITVQVPEIDTKLLNTRVEMNADQTLVLSVPKTAKEKKEHQPMCVMVRVRRVTSPHAAAPNGGSSPTEKESAHDEPASQQLKQFTFETSGWRLKFKSKDADLLEVNQPDVHQPYGDADLRADVRIRGGFWLEAVAEQQGDEKPDRIVAQAESAHITTAPASENRPARLQLLLDGDVRLVHNDSQLDAKQVLLRIDNSFVTANSPGRRPAAFVIEARDAAELKFDESRKLPWINLNGWTLRFSSHSGQQPDMREVPVAGKVFSNLEFKNGVKISAHLGGKAQFSFAADRAVVEPDTGMVKLYSKVLFQGHLRSNEGVLLFGVPIGATASRPALPDDNQLSVTLSGKVGYVDLTGNMPVRSAGEELRLILHADGRWEMGKATPDLRTGRYFPDDVQYFPIPAAKAGGALIDKVYPVADLVIPIPTGPIAVSPSGLDAKRETPAIAKPDFETLIELITSTIRPDSWKEAGGQGEIDTAMSSLSLVIEQEEQVHRQIAELLKQLRRLQDIQIVLTVQPLELPAAELEKVAKEERSPLAAIMENTKLRTWSLKRDSVSALKAIQGAKLPAAPKITAFNGQTVELVLGESKGDARLSKLLMQPVVTADYRSIRMQLGGALEMIPEPDRSERMPRSVIELAQRTEPLGERLELQLVQTEVAAGQTLVVDVSQFAWQAHERGVPLLDKVPGTSRLFKNASAKRPDTRHFYLITPQVLIVTEQEASRVLAPKPVK